MSELPIACTLQPGELVARSSELLPGLAASATRYVPIEGGYHFEFAPSTETLNAIIAVMDAERQCCRFLKFQLTVEPNNGAVHLDVTGPAGTRDFLDDLLKPASR